MILKVQSAMAISQGIQAVGESVDAFKQLGAVVKSFTIVQNISAAAQRIWNTAMAANPIGVIVVAVTALIAAGYALVNMFMSSSDASKKAEASNKALAKQLDNTVKSQKAATQEAELSRDLQLGLAKASGKSASEIRKLAVELANQEVAQKKANAQSLYAIAIEAQRRSLLEDASDQIIETAKKARKEYDDANNALKTSILNRKKLLNENKIAETQEQTDARQKSKENAEKIGQEQIAEKKKTNEELRKAEEDRVKNISSLEENYLKDLQNLNAKSDQEKLDLQKQRELAEINSLTKTAKEKENLLRLFEEKYNTLQQELDDKNAETKRIKLEEETKLRIEKEDLEWQRFQELTLQKSDYDKLILTQKYEQEYLAAEGNAALQTELKKKLEKDLGDIDDKAKEDEIRRQEEVAKLKEEQYRTNLDNLQNILSAGGKKLAGVSKALAIADIIRSSYKSISATISSTGEANAKAVAASPLTAGQPFVAINTVQAALSIASNVASATRSIKAITSDSTSAPSGGGQTAGGGGGGAAPSFNVVGNSGVNQLAETMQGRSAQAPIQAYVVANDVTTAQGLNRNIVTNASLG
jgi:hypothetical protein